MKHKIVEPPAAAIDWESFSDCVISTNWERCKDLEDRLGLSHGSANRAWHGKPVGVVTFLRICRAMKIDPYKFLMER